MVVRAAAVFSPRGDARERTFIAVAIFVVTFIVIAVMVVVIGYQNIGPTSIIISCEFVGISYILLGGASPSPSNPTGIEGAIGNHYLSPSRGQADLAPVAVLPVLDGCWKEVAASCVIFAESLLFLSSLLHAPSSDSHAEDPISSTSTTEPTKLSPADLFVVISGSRMRTEQRGVFLADPKGMVFTSPSSSSLIR